MTDWEGAKEEVKSRIRIEDVVRERVMLVRAGNKLKGSCPFHAGDDDPSFFVYIDEDPHYHCYGCRAHGDVFDFVMESENISFTEALKTLADRVGVDLPGKGVTPLHEARGLTLGELASTKKLPIEFLSSFGVCNRPWNRIKAVAIPHTNEKGETEAVLFRIALDGDDRFRYRRGDKASLYGLNRMAGIRKHGYVVFVEGSSDCWAGWFHHLPVIGIPGKGNWQSHWARKFDGVEHFVWKEPGADELVRDLARNFPDLRVIEAPEGIKDISEAHIQGLDVPDFVERLMREAPLASDMLRETLDTQNGELREQAALILASKDPLADVQQAIEASGYGGDCGPALIVYIAATSRLLAMRTGAMPVHLLLLGPSSAGKSYNVETVKRLLPPEAYHTIDASTPRVLIYDPADLQHKMVIFGEADSLPAGEDNPAASAIRNLLQDHRLHYKATVRDTETGGWTVCDINKSGPTMLVTTSTKRLGDQLETRLFILEVPDDQQQVRAALKAQGDIELYGAQEPPDSLIAYQSLLQAGAPWHILVPFADKLAEAIGKSPAASRVVRDYARLISLIKSVALLRHAHRQLDSEGRVLATLEDYRTIYDLASDMYAASTTGASKKVREVVNAVAELRKEDAGARITVKMVADRCGINKMAASRRVASAEKGGWLINDVADNASSNAGKNLVLGESLPVESGLPTPESLDFEDFDASCNSVTPNTVGHTPTISVNGNGHSGEDLHVPVRDVPPLQDTFGWAEVPAGVPLSAGTYRSANGVTYRRVTSKQTRGTYQ